MYGDIFGVNGVRDKILLTGYMPNGIVGALNTMGVLDGLRDNQNRPLFVDSMRNDYPYALRGMPLRFVENGSWDVGRALIDFKDIDGEIYNAGDTYPRECLTEKRIRQLSTGDNRTGAPVIAVTDFDVAMEMCGNVPDIEAMDIEQLRQFADEKGIELASNITSPDTARRRILEALGHGD